MGGSAQCKKMSDQEETAMKELIKQFLDDGLSRRQLMTGLGALGMSTVAAWSVAGLLRPPMKQSR